MQSIRKKALKYEFQLHQVLNGQSTSKDVKSVSMTPDGKTIVSGSEDHSVNVWVRREGDGPPSYELFQRIEGHSSLVNSVSLTSDGKIIVSSAGNKSVKVWIRREGDSPPTYEPLQTLEDSSSWEAPLATCGSRFYI